MSEPKLQRKAPYYAGDTLRKRYEEVYAEVMVLRPMKEHYQQAIEDNAMMDREFIAMRKELRELRITNSRLLAALNLQKEKCVCTAK